MRDAGRGQYVDVDGIQTFYIRNGDGPAVVLIHGASPGACSEINWKLNVDDLAAAGFAVYAFDQPGFGHSRHPADYSVEYRVAHARSFIDSQALDRFHLVGNSMGAYIAARIALEDRRAGRLVLVSSSTLAPGGSAAARMQAREHSQELGAFTPTLDNVRAMTMKTLYDRSLVTEALIGERLAMSLGARHEAHLKRRAAAPPRPVVDELETLKTKTLILWGRNDRGAVVERALGLFQLIPDAELHIFDRCGHWVQWDQAAGFNRLVADFLTRAS
jgi:pimeloyl-ACP methyl ester carboxylesterase